MHSSVAKRESLVSFLFQNSLLRNEMMTYQCFHSTFLSCTLDISRDRIIPHQMYPSAYHPWCKSVVSAVLRSSRGYIFIFRA